MSGFLNRLYKYLIVMVCGAAFICLLFTSHYLIALACTIIVYFGWLVNRKVRKISASESIVFTSTSNIRNIDRLVIGDMFSLPPELSDGIILQLAAPGRTLEACFEILRHTHSILRDDGTSEVIIAVKKRNIKKTRFSIFDIPFLHYITIERKKLNKLKTNAYYPLAYDPIGAILYLLKIDSRNYYETFDLSAEFTEFCKERGIIVRYFVKGSVYGLR